MELTDPEIELLEEIFEVIRDRACHYPDAEMGWSPEQVQTFYDLAKHRAEAKKRKFWWAR